MNGLVALAYVLGGIHAGGQHILPVGYAPSWSPNGARIAYVTRGDLWVADADGTHRALLVHRAGDPSWAPDGRRLAFSRDGWIWTVRADGLDERRLTRGAHPAWSPLGKRIAFDRNGEILAVAWAGGQPATIAIGEQPALAPDGRLALVRGGRIVVRGRAVGKGRDPSWSPDGRLAYVRERTIYVAGRAVGPGTQPDWRPAVSTSELLPDLDQRPATDLQFTHTRGRWLLGFTSYVDNVGLGALVVAGVRPPGSERMTATQRVLLANGKWRPYADVGRLRYTISPSHRHWHLMRFDTYELRSLDGRLLVRDRKSGFCLADHYGIAPGDFDRHARFLGNCGRDRPTATEILQGTSLGYTDRYRAYFHGQNVDVTGVPSGDYVLVHRANAGMRLRELRYENGAASLRIRLSWRRDVPSVRVLRRCPATASC